MLHCIFFWYKINVWVVEKSSFDTVEFLHFGPFRRLHESENYTMIWTLYAESAVIYVLLSPFKVLLI